MKSVRASSQSLRRAACCLRKRMVASHAAGMIGFTPEGLHWRLASGGRRSILMTNVRSSPLRTKRIGTLEPLK